MISDGTVKTVITVDWSFFKNWNCYLLLGQFHGQDEKLSLISLHKPWKAVLILKLSSSFGARYKITKWPIFVILTWGIWSFETVKLKVKLALSLRMTPTVCEWQVFILGMHKPPRSKWRKKSLYSGSIPQFEAKLDFFNSLTLMLQTHSWF